ncbi:hypothetical protein [Rhizobium herbae]|uniref:hypothetical protein n=1 Tax=Rhizobium herbae TaxID=508661 RepID=UPI001CB77C95|nr:hypothetical protein [Rhizobium herbae]
MSQSACAGLLSLAGGARSFQRIETGENGCDADLTARVLDMTDGAVTLQAMHETRLRWLKANRPEKFDAPVHRYPEAAE